MDTTAQPDEPHPENGPNRSGGHVWLLWGTVLLLVAYPLSIGSAVKLHRACPPAQPAIEAVYLPITFLMQRRQPLRAATLWYISAIWGEK
jgi:hypothetical protein